MISATRINYIILAASLAGITVIALFNLYPSLDLDIAGAFFLGDRKFSFMDVPIVDALRKFTMTAYGIWYLVICVALAIAFNKKAAVLGLAMRDWIYLISCSFIGPGILANLILKQFSGRARPRNVEEFGGSFDFSLVLNWSEECSSNCSFISGEVSSMYMIFMPLVLICTKRRWLLIVAMFLLGGLSSLMRIGQGAHFTSDCIMAGIIMIITAALLHKLIYNQPAINNLKKE